MALPQRRRLSQTCMYTESNEPNLALTESPIIVPLPSAPPPIRNRAHALGLQPYIANQSARQRRPFRHHAQSLKVKLLHSCETRDPRFRTPAALSAPGTPAFLWHSGAAWAEEMAQPSTRTPWQSLPLGQIKKPHIRASTATIALDGPNSHDFSLDSSIQW